MIKRYEHTQVGYLIIVVMAAVMVLIGVVLANVGINWIAIGVLVVIAVALVLFCSLTVVIWEDELEVRFGPGLIRKQFKLNEIESCQVGLIDFRFTSVGLALIVMAAARLANAGGVRYVVRQFGLL